MAKLLAKTLRDARWSAVGWSTGLLALALVHMAVFPSIEGDEALQEFYDQMPEALRNAFGGSRPFNTLEGYLQAEFGSYAPFMFAAFAITLANRALAGEEQDGHLDFLLAQPVQRGRIVLDSALAQAAGVALMAVATGLGLVLGSILFGVAADASILLLAPFNAVPLALAVGGVTFAASAWGHRRSIPLAVGTTLLIGSFFLNALAPLAEATRPLRKASLFYHYQGSDAFGGTFDWTYVAVGMAIWVIGVLVAVLAFDRKDIHA